MRILNLTGYKLSFIAMLLSLFSGSYAQIARHSSNDPLIVQSIMDTVIKKRMDRYHIPGFAFAIVKDGQLLLSKGYGYSDLEKKVPVVSDRTMFRMGSITKVFTATAMMQLVDEGKIKLDEGVNKYLTNKIVYKNNVPISLHHLLTHSAGFREIPGRRTDSFDKIIPMDVFLKDRLVQDHYAGEIAMYGTYGIALSGLILEQVSGMPYSKYIKEKILKPLEMDHTSIMDSATAHANLAVGYAYKKENFQPMDYEYYHTFPASDLNSTVNDMAKFMLMFLNNGKMKNTSVLSEQSAHNMQTTKYRNDPRLVGYSYGLFESTINGTRSYYHGGIMEGYASLMYLFPENNVGIVMACNTENQIFLGSILNNFLYYFFPEPKPHSDNPQAVLKTKLERFVGIYQRPGNPKIDIKLNADSTLSFWGGKWLQIEPLLFRVINGTLDTGEDLIAFKEDEQGAITAMTTGPFVYFKTAAAFTNKVPISFSKKDLNKLVGNYARDNNLAVRIFRKNKNLYASVNNDQPIRLQAQSKNTFFAAEYNAVLSFSKNKVEIQMNGETIEMARLDLKK